MQLQLILDAKRPRNYDPKQERVRLEPELLRNYTPGSKYARADDIRYGESGYKPIDPNVLTQAVHYWLKHGDGQRWSALEHAFLQRLPLFARRASGGAGDYMRPRWSIFQYMGGLKERWKEGEAVLEPAFKLLRREGAHHRSGLNSKDFWAKEYTIPPGLIKYIERFPDANPIVAPTVDYRSTGMTPDDYYA